MQRPEEVMLSPAEGAALMTRLEQDTWTREDRHVLVQILRMYFWLLFVVQEATFSLKRLRTLLFGAPASARRAPAACSPPVAAPDPEQAASPGATPSCLPLAITPPHAGATGIALGKAGTGRRPIWGRSRSSAAMRS